MLKLFLKNAVWMTVPLGLALGCAANRPTTTEADYGPSPAVLAPTSTSGEPESRIYSTVDPSASGSSSSQAAPGGASAQNWSVAAAIQQKMLQDTTLAPLGSSLIAEVGKDGQVTLKGNVSSQSEKERVHDTIAGVSGVSSVNDDQLGIGRSSSRRGTLDMNQSPQ